MVVLVVSVLLLYVVGDCVCCVCGLVCRVTVCECVCMCVVGFWSSCAVTDPRVLSLVGTPVVGWVGGFGSRSGSRRSVFFFVF